MNDEDDFSAAQGGEVYVKDAVPVISDKSNLWRANTLIDELVAIVRRSDGLPVLDSRSADEIIGYDENGLPC